MRAPNRAEIYQEFISWYVMPPSLRVQAGIHDQAEFAAYYHVSEDSLTRWKQRPDFEAKVGKIRRDWAFNKMPAMYDAILRSAIKGSASSQRLWMRLFKEFPANKEKSSAGSDEVTLNDIRFLIGQLPEEKREKYNVLLRDLLADIDLMEREQDSGVPGI